MTKLIVGFDSAWTPNNAGAIVAAILSDDGRWRELGSPVSADFRTAETQIETWRHDELPSSTLVMLDQPTVVPNQTRQRSVENIVASPVSLRYGGVQPANAGRIEMFGTNAPLWPFLNQFGGPIDPTNPVPQISVIETYPVLALIALGWTLPDAREKGRLPKYNPERRRSFSFADWHYVCRNAANFMEEAGLPGLSAWLTDLSGIERPIKRDQDALDACLCLIVAIHYCRSQTCLFVGQLHSGYMVVPYCPILESELVNRCRKTWRNPPDWVRQFQV